MTVSYLFSETGDPVYQGVGSLHISDDLGVGVSSPSYAVEFYDAGDEEVALVRSGVNGSALRIEDDDSFGYLGVEDSCLYMAFGVGLSGSQFVIDAIGEVGIGDTTPDYRLDVYHATEDGVAGFHSGDNRAYIHVQDNDTSGYLGAEGGGVFLAPGSTPTLATAPFMISSSGKVGIGDVTPNSRLDVHDDSDEYIATFSTSEDHGYISVINDTMTAFIGVDDGFTYIAKDVPIRGVARLVIDSVGNIGFNTDNFDATAVDVIAIANGTAPGAGTADQSYFYAKDVSTSSEMFVMDEAGNETQISPHNAEGDWEFFSRNVNTGKTVRINMMDLVRTVESLSGEKLVSYE